MKKAQVLERIELLDREGERLGRRGNTRSTYRRIAARMKRLSRSIERWCFDAREGDDAGALRSAYHTKRKSHRTGEHRSVTWRRIHATRWP